ncbi:B12-binding domain-containing radical SAM protein [Candidatus Bathyarchaeota archaeon]|nr:B12-binding domain-containing radical SAM protein [Candidatus Bathyarchaeota archaeon]
MAAKQSGYQVVLTADRTLMSEYGGGIFFGFSACIPQGNIPDSLYFLLLCPSVEVNGDGSVKYAPCGTRKVEAALLDYGFKREEVIVAHPEHLDGVIGPKTKVVGITENDPLGIGPATSTFKQILGGEAYMAVKFRELLNHPAIRRFKPKIIVGGGGAWQLEDREIRKDLGIDTVVIGEGEKIVGPLFEKAVAGETLPEIVYGEVVEESEIPIIRGPTVDGLVEIARGCGRGCAFCIPTLQRYRCLPIEHILKEVEVNVRAGRSPILHAEDVLRYGARDLGINKDAVINLFRSVKNHPGVKNVGISHFALSSVASAPEIIEEISNILRADEDGHWISGQTGIETGSPKLIKDHMAGKCRPFKPEEWPEVVINAFDVLAENRWVPCATLIIGLPGETEGDINLTIDLLEELKTFKSLLVPLFLVSEGRLKNRTTSFTLKEMTTKHSEVFLTCWEHNLYWAPRLLEEYLSISINNRIVRYGLKLVFSYAIEQGKKMIQKCRNDYENDLQAMISDVKSGKIDLSPLPVRIARPFYNWIFGR